MWLLWSRLALAQETVVASADLGVSPTENPCAIGLQTAIEAVRNSGSKAAYLCLSETDEAGRALLENLRQGGANQERATRALSLYLMSRLDRALTGEEVRVLNPADLRLLRDAVYARRGRASPAVDHVAVFQQFDWYKPNPKYTNGLLRDVDRSNLAMIDHPPPEPAPEPAVAAMAETHPALLGPQDKVSATGTCGCSTGEGTAGWGWHLGVGAGLTLLRRRRARHIQGADASPSARSSR